MSITPEPPDQLSANGPSSSRPGPVPGFEPAPQAAAQAGPWSQSSSWPPPGLGAPVVPGSAQGPTAHQAPPTYQPPTYQSPAQRAQQVVQRPQVAVVTWGIIAVCIAMWLAQRAVPGFYGRVAFAPALAASQPWRLLTSAFAHADNPTHILFNMLALWQVGRMLELALGRARFAALYLLSALGGGIGFYLLSTSPSAADPLGNNWFTGVVGASGAVFGLFGAMVPIYRRVGAPMQGIVITLVLNAAISVTIPGIAWQSHLGGFLVGLLIGWILVSPGLSGCSSGPDRRWPALAGVTLALVLLLVAKALRG